MLHEELRIIDKSGKTSFLKIDQSRLQFVGSDGNPQWVLLSKKGGVLSIDKDIQIGNITLSKQTGINSEEYLRIKESDTNWVDFRTAGMFIHGDMQLTGNLGSASGQNGDLYVNNLHAKTISCSGELSAPSIYANTIKATNGDITASNGTISAPNGSISARTIRSTRMTATEAINLGTIEGGGKIEVTLRPWTTTLKNAAVVHYGFSRKVNSHYEKLDASITGFVGSSDSSDSSGSYMKCFFRNVTDLDLYFLLDSSSKHMEREFSKYDSAPDGYFLLTGVCVNENWETISNAKVSSKNEPNWEGSVRILLGHYDKNPIVINGEKEFYWLPKDISKIKGIVFNIVTTTIDQQ